MPYKTPDDRRIFQQKRQQELRNEVLDSLGGRCVKCGYKRNRRALQLDHINGDGRVDRKGRGASYYSRLLRTPYLHQVLQVLCANCHQIKTYKQKDHLAT